MFEYRAELERRIEQFRHYLGLMPQRRAGIVQGNCFIIFDEQLPRSYTDREELTESKALVYESVQEASNWDGEFLPSLLDDSIVIDLPNEGWRGDDSPSRFIQFSFNSRYFDMDVPTTTLFRAEAEQILRCRSGFFYVKDRRQFEHPGDKVDTFNPLRKVYIHGDERAAAEDMAYIWFGVWRFPVDWRFHVTANAFHERTQWENGVPIE